MNVLHAHGQTQPACPNCAIELAEHEAPIDVTDEQGRDVRECSYCGAAIRKVVPLQAMSVHYGWYWALLPGQVNPGRVLTVRTAMAKRLGVAA